MNVMLTAAVIVDSALLKAQQNLRRDQFPQKRRVARVAHSLINNPTFHSVLMVALNVVDHRSRCGLLHLVQKPVSSSDVFLPAIFRLRNVTEDMVSCEESASLDDVSV